MGGGLQKRGTFIEDVQHNDFIAMSLFHVKHLHVQYLQGSYNLKKVLNSV